MFSSALKSMNLKSNIGSNYSVSPNTTTTAGPWKIYDAKKKSTGKPYSVFVFDKKSLEQRTGGFNRTTAAGTKRAVEEVVERLKKEASSLARLRHPNVLELVEPVEETRGGGLQFATEPVTASLASLLQEKDEQERAVRVGGRSSRFVTEDQDGTRRRREIEMDELEIQKGLLQIGRALEFLHDNAELVHGNLTPDAILVNAKSDWKISGLAFSTPLENTSRAAPSLEHIATDDRLPPHVQLSLDYTSPDLILYGNMTTSADMFSLGLLCVALYNSPHRSPLEANGSVSTYKRIFQSSSQVPSPRNGFLCSRPLPKELSAYVLPRLIARSPAQRLTAKEFQHSEYFNNVLVSTIRFLDSFPAKTPAEKNQFMRGLIKVLPSFPKSVLEKKVLPALLDEMKEKELISLILHNVFKIIDLLPSGRRAFGDKIRPSLKAIFVANAKQPQEKDAARDAGLMIILEQLSVIVDNCNGKEFKDDILPIIYVCLESPTPAVIDTALRSLPIILPVMDFTTIKNEMFPVIAMIFSRTNCLNIKVRGLQAFVYLCGGSINAADDGLNGIVQGKKTSSSTALDKYTMQEKIVPLVKGIKTKEPAVMIASLDLLRVVGQTVDAEFIATDILPILWNMSLGPLLNLKQFQEFMESIKSLSRKVEDEQTKKLTDLMGNSNDTLAMPADDFLSLGAVTRSTMDANGATEDDFERLVKGNTALGSPSAHPLDTAWDSMTSGAAITFSPPSKQSHSKSAAAFSWSTPSPATAAAPTSQFSAAKPLRTVASDLASIGSLTPTTTQFSQPLQPMRPTNSTQSSLSCPAPSMSLSAINWGAASNTATANSWASFSNVATMPLYGTGSTTSAFGNTSLSQPGIDANSSSFSLSRPPTTSTPTSISSLRLLPPPGSQQSQQQANSSFGGIGMGINSMAINSMSPNRPEMGQQAQPSEQPTSGLDKYASLL